MISVIIKKENKSKKKWSEDRCGPSEIRTDGRTDYQRNLFTSRQRKPGYSHLEFRRRRRQAEVSLLAPICSTQIVVIILRYNWPNLIDRYTLHCSISPPPLSSPSPPELRQFLTALYPPHPFIPPS